MSSASTTGTTGARGGVLSYDDALKAVLKAASPLPVELVALEDALGRALAEPLVSPVKAKDWSAVPRASV